MAIRGRVEGGAAPYGGWVWFWAVRDSSAPAGYQVISEGVLETWDAAMGRVAHWIEVER